MGHHKEREVPQHSDYKVGKTEKAKKAAPPKATDEEMEGIRSQQERLIHRLQELRGASHDAWEELKNGAENAFEELRGSMQKVITRFESALKEHKQ